MEFSPQIVFGHEEQIHWPFGSQHINERFFDDDVRRFSIKWLSAGQIDELTGLVLQTIFEQSIRSSAKDEYICLFKGEEYLFLISEQKKCHHDVINIFD
jgi:hypothetical protein